MKKLLVLRGLPGSGKTTYAKNLNGIICSADDFFCAKGVYLFDRNSLQDAHDYCYNKVVAAMEQEMKLIILDNTNTRRSEYSRYVEAAKEHGYFVEEKIIGEVSIGVCATYAFRNRHGVPLKVIQNMARRFEI
jgi:predicted kinase